MILSIIAISALVYAGYAAWKQLPPEDPETIAARERYGRVGD